MKTPSESNRLDSIPKRQALERTLELALRAYSEYGQPITIWSNDFTFAYRVRGDGFTYLEQEEEGWYKYLEIPEDYHRVCL